MTTPYSISLLNDLHNHFPDLLYQPQRFNNVHDVLRYVVQVANQNPYEREQTNYLRRINQPPLQRQQEPSVYSYFNIDPDNLPHHIPLPRILNRTLLSPQRVSSTQILNEFMNQINAAIPNYVRTENIVPAPFLNDRVVVRPTNDQIDEGTIILTANQLNQDNCAICQDPMEIGQTIRMIRHCTHRFHQTCIDPWLEQHVTCPTCRHDIRDRDEDEV
jgi:hypothetical protein